MTLGFLKTDPFGAGDRKSEYPVEDGTYNLYVYCDLIEPVVLGNAIGSHCHHLL